VDRPSATPVPIGGRSLAKSGEHLREAIYGTVVQLGLIGVLSEREHPSVHRAAFAIGGTAFVLFLAHVYAGVLAGRILQGRQMTRHDVARLADESWPIVAVAAWPLALVGLTWLRVLPLTAALDLAVGIAVASLVLWGWYAARLSHAGLSGRLRSTAVSLSLGLLIVGLKALIA
jgi:hypothetical protein